MSSSKSNQSTTQNDNRDIIGENGINAENSRVNVWNESVDNEIVNRALESVDNGTAEALSFGKTALTQNGNVLADVLAFAETAFGKAITYTGTVQSDAMDNLGDTAQLVKDAYEDAKGRGALTDKILIGAIIAMAVVAWGATRK